MQFLSCSPARGLTSSPLEAPQMLRSLSTKLSSRSDLLVSSTIVRINIHGRLARWVIRLVKASIAVLLNVAVPRKVVVNGRKVFVTISLPYCEEIDFLGHIRQRHGHAGLVSAHRGQVQ